MLALAACLLLAILTCSTNGLQVVREQVVKIGKSFGQHSRQDIPKIIHQTWKNSTLPPEFEKWSRSWQDCLPDWEYKLHTDEDNRNLIKDKFPELLETYDNYDPLIKRVDAARYAYLATEGGLYADLDMECVHDPALLTDLSIDGDFDLTLGCEKFSNGGQISNAIMLSTSDAGRAFFKQVLRRLPQSSSLETCYATGPQLLTHVFMDYLTDGAAAFKPEERANMSEFLPAYGTVKSLQKSGANIAVADDALLLNVPWYALDTKQYCMDREWCKRRFPYAMSVSHWSSSWLPEINTLPTGDFVRTFTFENKKCAADGEDRLFKLDELFKEAHPLDTCNQACKANPECKFFSMFRERWCIGCRREPSDDHAGSWTYQMTRDNDTRAESAEDAPKAVRARPSSSQLMERVTKSAAILVPALENKKCPVEGDSRLFIINEFPAHIDQVEFCSQTCKDMHDCSFFSIRDGEFCVGCKAEPTSQHDLVKTYKMTGEGSSSNKLSASRSTGMLDNTQRDPFFATTFMRAFALDNKKCPDDHSDRVFRIGALSADVDQIYTCSEMCKQSPECTFFTVHLNSQWCIGCRAEPSEDEDGSWAYVMTRQEVHASTWPSDSIQDGSGEIAPLIQSGESEFRSPQDQQLCSCLIEGLTGVATTVCQHFLKQQTSHWHVNGASRRGAFQQLLDSHMHRCSM